MSNAPAGRVEPVLRLVVGFLLWSISGLLTLSLLLDLSDGSFGQRLLLGAVGIGLEGAKILSWRAGGKARMLAIALIVLSATASLGASLRVVENAKASFDLRSLASTQQSPSYRALITEVESIDVEISALIARIDRLPPDYTTAMKNLTGSLQLLRDRRRDLLNAQSAMEASAEEATSSSNIFVLLGKTFRTKPDVVMLVLLLFISTVIEAGALILTVPVDMVVGKVKTGKEPSESMEPGKGTAPEGRMLPQPSYQPPITPDEFLEAAKQGADLPFLHGRDKTAGKLGVSCADAKRLVSRLISDGKVAVEGKRLRLTCGE